MSDEARQGLTRREVGGIGARGALGLGGLGLGVAGLLAAAEAEIASGQIDPEKTILSTSLGLQRALLRVYEAALDNGNLGAPDTKLARMLAGQAERHIKALTRVTELGTGTGGSAPAGPRSAKSWFESAYGFETQAYISYLDAVAALDSRNLIALSVALGQNTAEHFVLLRERLGIEPIPTPYETG